MLVFWSRIVNCLSTTVISLPSRIAAGGALQMVTAAQVRRCKRLPKMDQNQEAAAAQAGMDAKTARKYLREGQLPSEARVHRRWRARPDPFTEVWEEVRRLV